MIINKIFYWLKCSIIAVMLMLGGLLAILHFASHFFESYHTSFEKFVGDIIRQPVQVGAITMGGRGLEPAILFHNISILSTDKTKVLLRAKELRVGIDLVGSLFHWQIRPGLFLISGSEFTIRQAPDGKITVIGIPQLSESDSGDVDKSGSILDKIFSQLLDQVRIDIEDVRLKWCQSDNEVVQIDGLYLSLRNNVLQHTLKIGGKLKQEHSPAIFKADLRTRGNFLLDHKLSALVGEVKIKNWFGKLGDQQAFGGDSFMPVSGDIRLSVKDSYFASKLFRQPIAVKNLNSRVVWNHRDDDLQLNISNLSFADEYLFLSGGGELYFQAGSKMPMTDIKMSIKLLNMAKAKLYYPVSLLPRDATTWLDQAFVSGKIVAGEMILKGPLDKFPFDHGEGKFLVDTNLCDVHLRYDAEWPHIEEINGKMLFSNRSLTVLANSAKIVNEQVASIKVTIDDLDLPILDVLGNMNADSSSGLRFVGLSPLKNSIGRKLQSIKLNGPMKFSLKMRMPLSDDVSEKETKVDGDVNLYNNNMRIDGWSLVVNKLQGDLAFNENDLAASGLNGEMFNNPVDVDIRTAASNNNDTVTQVKINGSARVKDFEQVFAINLHPYMSGKFNFNALLDLHDSAGAQNIFKLNSDLQGVEIDLPPPFAKKLTNSCKFNLTYAFGGNKIPQLFINYNDQISSVLLIKNIGTKDLQIAAGEVKFGAGPVNLSVMSGLMITGALDKFDWSIWKSYLEKAKTNFAESSSKIKQISLNMGELHVLGQVLKKAALKALPRNKGWEITLMTPEINGKVYWPDDDKAYIRGVFKKLYITEKQQNSSMFKPDKLSSLDFKINSFRYNDRYFNGVELIAEHKPNGLKINKFVINDEAFHVEADGDWILSGDGQFSRFRGKLTSSNFGDLLKQWDLTSSMVDGIGAANFILRWADAPYHPSLPKLRGAVALKVNGGRIVNLSRQTENKLGFGRVLNMLSLQNLPQRLSLDFSDLTKHGFGFNSMSAQFELGDSNAFIKKLTLDGQVAYIKAYGRIGLKAQDYDMMMSVVPHNIASSILPVTGAIAGGPVGGVLGFIADKVISTGIKKTVTNTYHITGSWDEPKVNKA